MTLHQFRVFQAVSKHLSVTRAASELHLSQPCVSTQLKLLEHEFGVQFYVKQGQGIKLTKQGEKFATKIEPILQQVNELPYLFKLQRGEVTSLEIGVGQNFAFLPKVFRDLKQRHPNVNFVLKRAHSPVVEQLVAENRLDIGIITNPSHKYDGHLITQPFSSEKVVAVVSYKHPLAKTGSLNLNDLARTPVLIWRQGIARRELEQRGVKLNVTMECDASDPLIAAAAAGLGLGFCYRSTVKSTLRSGELKCVRISGLKPIIVKTVIIYPNNRKLTRHVEDFVALLLQLASNHQTTRRKAGHSSHFLPI